VKEGTRKLFESLKFCNYKLSFVLDITQKIIDNHPIEEIMILLSDLLTKKLLIKQFLFYYKEEDSWRLKFALGVDEKKFSQLDVEEVLGGYNDIVMVRDSHSPIGIFDFVIPIMYRSQVQAYLLVGDLEDTNIGMSPAVKNLRFVQTIANVIVMAMEKRKLILEAIERERMKKELETASRIQRMLIPDVQNALPQNSKYKVFGFYLPHYELGGDLYDLGLISRDEFYFAIADVSGKGLSAALLMSNFQANLRAQFSSGVRLEAIIRNLNEIVVRNSEGGHFITLFVGKYNFRKNRLIYVNAGHQPGLLYDKVTGNLTVLSEGTVGIGMLDEIPKINFGRITIKHPSKLLLYTDGVSELARSRNVDAGIRKLQRLIKNDLPIDETIKRLIRELKLNKENPRVFDDITLLGFDFNV